MTETFELHSPFLNVEFDARGMTRREQRIASIVWMAFWAPVTVGALYTYVALLPGWVGFETTVLIGLGIIALGAFE